MKLIPLTQGKFAKVDDADFERLAAHKWFAWLHKRDNVWYARRHAPTLPDGRRPTLGMHREILGLLSPQQQADHRDGDGLNNQRANLRESTNRQNCCNKGKQRGTWTSPFKGVSWRKDRAKWASNIRVEGRLKHLGYFSSEAAAAQVYDVAACHFHGEFARLNFPSTFEN